MKKIILTTVAVICIILMAGLTACGEDKSAPAGDEQETETTAAAENPMDSMTPEQINEEMVGVWVPAEGFEDVYYFGYTSDQGISADTSGKLAIQADYVQFDGGGISTVDYALEEGKMVYTSYVSEYSAGGEIGNNGIIEVSDLQENAATINGAAYEKLANDPTDPEELATKAINDRLLPLITGEWENSDGTFSLKINKDGTMHYSQPALDVDGTWETWGNTTVTLNFTSPYSMEDASEYYQYSVDEDCMNGAGMTTETLYRK